MTRQALMIAALVTVALAAPVYAQYAWTEVIRREKLPDPDIEVGVCNWQPHFIARRQFCLGLGCGIQSNYKLTIFGGHPFVGEAKVSSGAHEIALDMAPLASANRDIQWVSAAPISADFLSRIAGESIVTFSFQCDDCQTVTLSLQGFASKLDLLAKKCER
jgi:hypothetical protein